MSVRDHRVPMDGVRVGRIIVAVRQNKGLRQADVGRLARVSQSVVSRIERALIRGITVETMDRIATALELDLRIELRGRSGDVDRLVDREHASLVELVVARLRAGGWEVLVEYTFNHFGERGSVDVLAFHTEHGALLIVEVKSRLTDLQAFLASFGRKLRLVPDLVRSEPGWDVHHVGRVLVITGTTANRAIVQAHGAVFNVSFPTRARGFHRWLRAPVGPLAAVWFVSGSRRTTGMRVRRVRRAAGPPPDVPGD
jgi:transcriptional regulator with XRE-family HTH domain